MKVSEGGLGVNAIVESFSCMCKWHACDMYATCMWHASGNKLAEDNSYEKGGEN